MTERAIVPVLLCGGQGARLWPVSTQHSPKQFMPVPNTDVSFLQATLARFADAACFRPAVVVTHECQRFIAAEQARAINAKVHLLLEPASRNTAASMMAAATYVAEQYGDDAVMLVVPADHMIQDSQAYANAVRSALQKLESHAVMLFGIVPDAPHTGYGYVHCPSQAKGWVQQFVEKPDIKQAQAYIDSGEYYYNSGMFMAHARSFVRLLQQFQPALAQHAKQATTHARHDADFIWLWREEYERCASISFDYAVMEHATQVQMQPLDCGWADIGSWQEMWRHAAKDADGNAATGKATLQQSRNCYVYNASNKPIAALGLSNVCVVASKQAVLVADMQHAQHVKQLAQQMDEALYVKKPWGHYEVLEAAKHYKMKRLCLHSGAATSLQLHAHRCEYWLVVQGSAKVQLEAHQYELQAGDAIYVPKQAAHRLMNSGRGVLEVIEIQSGSHVSEDDITRLEDDYGRACQPHAIALTAQAC